MRFNPPPHTGTRFNATSCSNRCLHYLPSISKHHRVPIRADMCHCLLSRAITCNHAPPHTAAYYFAPQRAFASSHVFPTLSDATLICFVRLSVAAHLCTPFNVYSYYPVLLYNSAYSHALLCFSMCLHIALNIFCASAPLKAPLSVLACIPVLLLVPGCLCKLPRDFTPLHVPLHSLSCFLFSCASLRASMQRRAQPCTAACLITLPYAVA